MTISIIRWAFWLALPALLLPSLTFAQYDCADKTVTAAGIRNREDIRAFVQCAREYALENGFEEARRAFNEDERWKSGQFYVFVDGNTARGEDSLTLVYPPDNSREGGYWGPLIDRFGNDYFKEVQRVTSDYGGGYAYYSVPNSLTGNDELKAAYVMPIDWDGTPAVIGAGIHEQDLPGACYPGSVNAASLAASPSPDRLRDLVRCAAHLVESKGFFATNELTFGSRWNDGSVYAFGTDLTGVQVYSGEDPWENGELGELGDAMEKFLGRDIFGPALVFGEMFLLYMDENPVTEQEERKLAFVKRVNAQGIPILVASGYFLPEGVSVASDGLPACADKSVAASAIRTTEDIQAFVLCAREYALMNGVDEAARAFREEARWKSGPYYLYVNRIPEPGGQTYTLVHGNRSREGQSFGPLIDALNNDFFLEEARLAQDYGGGWMYYSFLNPALERPEYKASYHAVIDDWDGAPAVIGAGLYPHDLFGNCDPDQVSAATVAAESAPERLMELVRCAAHQLEGNGYLATTELTTNPRWSSGSVYTFGMDLSGIQTFSGNSVRVNGRQLQEWGDPMSPAGPFRGRDVISAADAFGETFLYYKALNPATGRSQRKVSFVKRVTAQGTPVLVGSGYYLPDL